MEAKEDQLRDWSSLLPEILNLIAKNLSEISDFVRFRAVCKAWRFSTPITDQPLQFPWIVYRHEEETGVIKAIDMFTGTIVYDIPTTEDYSIGDALYMVEDSGDILIVTQRYSDSERFDVYQLEANKSGSPCWVKVTNIGDRALFIGCSCSALILRANNFARIKSNSIYFFCNYNNDKCEIKRMDIATSAVEHLQDFFRRLPVWFVPNLYHL
ncbi:hypothetical protein LUZ61_012247 [Rhynchospora tenuis]|uniref:KIB1-4 beta-propeller domain-containing protein n=1 Tax=Rhynchospora tenuis TaxID=198213 RepID=A0AAD6A2I6_9POAL|nr:hypothetical protein LUZ61_012247 [Rhynchospora tenuis]